MTGRERYTMSAKSAKHGGKPRARPIAPLEFGRESFRLTCRRRRGTVNLPTLTLDEVVTGFGWERAGAVMSGDLTLGDPALRRLPGLVVKGDVVRCEVRTRLGAAWRPLWEMTVETATRSVASRTTEVTLKSRLKPAQDTRVRWKFRKDSRHPQGWTADQITRFACKRLGVDIGTLPRGRNRIVKLIDKSASLVEIVTKAWQEEREANGRRFDVSVARGLMDVREVRRPRYMLRLGPTLTDAVKSDGVAAKFATAVVVTSTAKAKGSHKRHKIRVEVVDQARVRRSGYIRRTVSKAGLSSAAEARKFGRRWLARVAQPWTTITLTHDGIPWVQRGDGVRLDLPDELLTADVYLLSASHRVDYGAYTMELRATVTDIYKSDERAQRVKRRKAEAARRRGRRTRDPHARDRLEPKKAAKHS